MTKPERSVNVNQERSQNVTRTKNENQEPRTIIAKMAQLKWTDLRLVPSSLEFTTAVFPLASLRFTWLLSYILFCYLEYTLWKLFGSHKEYKKEYVR